MFGFVWTLTYLSKLVLSHLSSLGCSEQDGFRIWKYLRLWMDEQMVRKGTSLSLLTLLRSGRGQSGRVLLSVFRRMWEPSPHTDILTVSRAWLLSVSVKHPAPFLHHLLHFPSQTELWHLFSLKSDVLGKILGPISNYFIGVSVDFLK